MEELLARHGAAWGQFIVAVLVLYGAISRLVQKILDKLEAQQVKVGEHDKTLYHECMGGPGLVDRVSALTAEHNLLSHKAHERVS